MITHIPIEYHQEIKRISAEMAIMGTFMSLGSRSYPYITWIDKNGTNVPYLVEIINRKR